MRTKARNLSCPRSSCSICPTITPAARVRTCRAPRPRWPTTIWRSAAWSMRFRTALTGTTLRSSCLEDDAQDGADHVDAHRSIAFVISKYSPGSAGTAECGAPLLHDGEPDSHHGDAARPSAHESERCLRAGDGAVVFRRRRPARVQGRLPQPEEWADLRKQQARSAGREALREDGFLASRRRRGGPAESSVVAAIRKDRRPCPRRSIRCFLRAGSSVAVSRLSGGSRVLRLFSVSSVSSVAKIKIPLTTEET